MNSASIPRTLAIAVSVLATTVQAQSIAELNQQVGVCTAQADRTKRAQCFERLARDAISELERAKQLPPPVAQQSEQPKPTLGKHADFIAKAKSNVTAGFKDSSSVQWRNLFVSGSKLLALCGEINAKNSYGAYVGFRRFFATSEPMLQEIENPEQPYVLEKMWGSMCTEELEKVE